MIKSGEMEKKKLIINIGSLLLAVIVLVAVTIALPIGKMSQKKATLGAGSVLLAPSTETLEVNEQKTVSLYLTNPNQKKISFVDVRLSFNKDVLEITEFTPNPDAFPVNLTGTDINLLGKTTGRAKLQAVNSGTALKNNDSILIGSIKIKGKASGVSQITITDSTSQVVGENPSSDDLALGMTGSQGGTYTVTGGNEPTVTPSVGPTASPTIPAGTAPVLSFKIKFQGISSKKVDQKVKVSVKKTGVDEAFENVNVSSNNEGIYSGSVILRGVSFGSGYKIFIKGPKHLTKKFCEDKPTSRCTGEGRITLVSGANTFDFATQVLEAGDLPDGGVQDGVVNSLDYSLWKSRFGKEDATNLAVADINLDGIVNTADWNLMRITLETKYEDDN